MHFTLLNLRSLVIKKFSSLTLRNRCAVDRCVFLPLFWPLFLKGRKALMIFINAIYRSHLIIVGLAIS